MEEIKEKIAVNAEIKANSNRGAYISSDSIRVTSMSRNVTLLFAAACGMSVANIYFAQPLLDQLSSELVLTIPSLELLLPLLKSFMD